MAKLRLVSIWLPEGIIVGGRVVGKKQDPVAETQVIICSQVSVLWLTHSVDHQDSCFFKNEAGKCESDFT